MTTTAATIGTLSAGLDVFGSSTFRLFDTMYVAETIMMMRRTSMTSTIGVMLISAIALRPPPLFIVPAPMG